MSLQLSIIIPTYNEEENIENLLSYLQKNDPQNLTEIIVCDGQSIDKTKEAATLPGVKIFVSPLKGRAAQMNYGAAFAKSPVLYFIHSDCFPPPTFIKDIEQAVKAGYEIGRYKTKFDSDKLMLKINAWFTRFNWFICYGGDQTLFITKKLFNKMEGYKSDMHIMEEYDLVNRAAKSSKYKIFKKATLVSARKYDTNSWLTVQLANRKIIKMFRNGASQNELLTKYKELLNYR